MLGITNRLDHKPRALSGGEQQRVAIARALVNQPAILLADEPTGNLDTANSNAVLDLLRDLNKRIGQTILMITHNPEAAAFADRIVSHARRENRRERRRVKFAASRSDRLRVDSFINIADFTLNFSRDSPFSCIHTCERRSTPNFGDHPGLRVLCSRDFFSWSRSRPFSCLKKATTGSCWLWRRRLFWALFSGSVWRSADHGEYSPGPAGMPGGRALAADFRLYWLH